MPPPTSQRKLTEAQKELLKRWIDEGAAWGGHWAFPKGHANVGETELETARRELREETGIRDVDIKPGQIFEERYTKPRWHEPKTIIVKSVRYFIGEVKNPNLILQASEVQDAKWVAYAEARHLISFVAGRTLLDDAARVLGIGAEK